VTDGLSEERLNGLGGPHNVVAKIKITKLQKWHITTPSFLDNLQPIFIKFFLPADKNRLLKTQLNCIK
jgi:hypothetical protein